MKSFAKHDDDDKVSFEVSQAHFSLIVGGKKVRRGGEGGEWWYFLVQATRSRLRKADISGFIRFLYGMGEVV
jgi:hypothetical protein